MVLLVSSEDMTPTGLHGLRPCELQPFNTIPARPLLGQPIHGCAVDRVM